MASSIEAPYNGVGGPQVPAHVADPITATQTSPQGTTDDQ